jgi:thiamine pyrophosphate-dependent acetolactate synthase large subunit-like protein
MVGSDTAQRVMPLLERAIGNRYAQENLQDAAEKLRAAYQRASKRRVEPTRDEKLREQLRQAALSITEAGRAIKTGRQKSKNRWGRRLLAVIGLGTVGAAAALAASEELRRRVLGDGTERQQPDDVAAEAAADKVAV